MNADSSTIVFSVVIFFLGLFAMGSWFSGNKLPVDGKTVLITGASQGLGLSAARILSSKGANVIIAARNQERLDRAIQEIAAAAKSARSQRFHAISADLTLPEENSRLLSEATKWNNGNSPDVIWANAGAASPMFFLDADIKLLRSQMDVNYWTACYLAHETLASWLGGPIKASTEPLTERHFIMTCSTAAIVGGLPGYAPYSPTKAAVRCLHDTLKAEADYYNAAHKTQRQKGQATPPHINVHTILPGTILTAGLEEENKTKPLVLTKLEETDPPQTPEVAAQAAIKGLEAGRGLIPTQGLLGEAVLGLGFGGSTRDRPVLDLIFAWIAAIVWIFVGWDMDSTAKKIGAKEGPPKRKVWTT